MFHRWKSVAVGSIGIDVYGVGPYDIGSISYRHSLYKSRCMWYKYIQHRSLDVDIYTIVTYSGGPYGRDS